jgi:hypothetical protein
MADNDKSAPMIDHSRRALLRSAALAAGGAATLGLAPGALASRKTTTPTAVVPVPASPDDITQKKIDDIIKGFTKLSGVLTLYRQQDNLYVELTPEQLDKPYLLQATRETGTAGSGGIAGDPLADILFQFHANSENDQIYLIEPNLTYRANPASHEEISLERSFAESYLASYPIAAYRPPPDQEKTIAAITDVEARRSALQKAAIGYLIHIPTFFTADIPNFAANISGYSIDQSQTYLKSIKDFPNNLVVRTSYAFTGSPASAGFFGLIPQPDAGSLADPRDFAEEVDYNIFPLIDTGYQPRFYDDRIGYFTQDYETFNEDTSPSNIRRMILRWNLKKKDPGAILSDPVTPIVFWIDNATPDRYRNALRDGVLTWNAAFEPLGFQNAVQCEIMPDDTSWDPADMTHNVVRWTSSYGAGYAVAQFRHNPLTGEIINAAITIDASMARFTNLDYPALILNGELTPSVSQNGLVAESAPTVLTPPQVAATIINAPPTIVPANRCECDYGPGITKAAAFGWDCLTLIEEGSNLPNGRPTLDEFTNRYLHSVVSHESGHCLGLRHNFKGSTMLTQTQRQDSAMTAQYGVTASVMDYLPANVPPLGGRWADIWTPCIGPYDQWAIAYGYSDFGDDPVLERTQLETLASHSQDFGHAFASDEDADGIDPMITRFDLGAQPIDFRIVMVQRSHYLLKNLEYHYPAPGQTYYDLTRLFIRTLNQYAENALEVARFIGGVLTNRNHADDPEAVLPVSAVPYSQQRQALKALCDYVYSTQSLQFSPSLLSKLQADPSPASDQLPASFNGAQDISVLDFVNNIQDTGLYVLLNHDLLSRLEANEYRSGQSGSPLTVLETLQTVTNAVWTELDGKPHTIGLVRRRLQRTYITAMIGLIKPSAADSFFSGSTNGDSGAFSLVILRRLAPRIAAAEKLTTDPSTSAHLTETHQQIVQFLHAQEII